MSILYHDRLVTEGVFSHFKGCKSCESAFGGDSENNGATVSH